MYAILRGANSRRHEVDFGDDPVVVEVSMSGITVQITMTAPGDLDPDWAQFVTITVPREQLVAAMAEAVNRRSKPGGVTGIWFVGEGNDRVKAGLLEPQTPGMERHIHRHGMYGRCRREVTVSPFELSSRRTRFSPRWWDVGKCVSVRGMSSKLPLAFCRWIAPRWRRWIMRNLSTWSAAFARSRSRPRSGWRWTRPTVPVLRPRTHRSAPLAMAGQGTAGPPVAAPLRHRRAPRKRRPAASRASSLEPRGSGAMSR
jgi:hypothetical protein